MFLANCHLKNLVAALEWAYAPIVFVFKRDFNNAIVLKFENGVYLVHFRKD